MGALKGALHKQTFPHKDSSSIIHYKHTLANILSCYQLWIFLRKSSVFCYLSQAFPREFLFLLLPFTMFCCPLSRMDPLHPCSSVLERCCNHVWSKFSWNLHTHVVWATVWLLRLYTLKYILNKVIIHVHMYQRQSDRVQSKHKGSFCHREQNTVWKHMW